MRTHDWTGIEWGEEFGFLPKNINVQGEGNLAPEDEVIVRFKVDAIERFRDEPGQFRAVLVPAGVEPMQSIWQRLGNFLNLKRSV